MHGESRWPYFAAEAESLGVRSMLCVPLRVHEQCLGTLSLYSERRTAFTDNDEQVTTLFDTLAAIALAEAQRTGQLTPRSPAATSSARPRGILMERRRITADAAVGCLSRASQDVNIKLTAVAGDESDGRPDPAPPAARGGLDAVSRDRSILRC